MDVFNTGGGVQPAAGEFLKGWQCFSMGRKARSPSGSGADKKLPSGSQERQQLSVLACLVWEHSLSLYNYGVGFHILKTVPWKVQFGQSFPPFRGGVLKFLAVHFFSAR